MNRFFLRLFPKIHFNHFIAIDIGSNAAIRSLLFKESSTETIAVEKQNFELPVRSSESELIPAISEYLHALITQYIRTIGHIPEGILVGLGNHFTFNEMKTITKERERPEEPIHQREFQAILNQFLEDHRVQVIRETRYALAHLMPFRITVDGYPIETLGPKTRGRTIEVVLFGTYAEEKFWQALFDLRSMFGGLELRFISNQAVIAAALVSALGITDALVIKIGAKITEISLLGNGAIRFTSQFEKGGDDVTHAIAACLRTAPRDAERVKCQQETVALPRGGTTLLRDAEKTAALKWIQELARLLKSEERFVLPEHVYILGGGARLEAIRDALTSINWFDDLTFLAKLDIQMLNAEDIAGQLFRNTSQPLSGPEEVAIAALARRMSRRSVIKEKKSHEVH